MCEWGECEDECEGECKDECEGECAYECEDERKRARVMIRARMSMGVVIR